VAPDGKGNLLTVSSGKQFAIRRNIGVQAADALRYFTGHQVVGGLIGETADRCIEEGNGDRFSMTTFGAFEQSNEQGLFQVMRGQYIDQRYGHFYRTTLRGSVH